MESHIACVRQAIVVSLAVGSILLGAAAAWAWGGGDGRSQLRFEYRPETPAEDPEEKPQGFDYPALTFRYQLSNRWGVELGVRYQAPSSDTEKPATFAIESGDIDWGRVGGLTRISLADRFLYRYPSLDGFGDDRPADAGGAATDPPRVTLNFPGFTPQAGGTAGSAGSGESATQTPRITMIFPGFTPQVWLAPEPEEDIPVVEEQVTRLRANFTNAPTGVGIVSPETIRAFAEWAEQETAREATQRFLGDDAFNRLQEQFGPQTNANAASDLSEWNNVFLYCGGTCVLPPE